MQVFRGSESVQASQGTTAGQAFCGAAAQWPCSAAKMTRYVPPVDNESPESKSVRGRRPRRARPFAVPLHLPALQHGSDAICRNSAAR